MAAQNIGIVYSVSQQVIRRVIDTRWIGWDDERNPIADPNAGDHLLSPHQDTLQPGEAWVLIPCDVYDTHISSLETHQYLGLTGIPGITDRNIVVDSSSTVATVIHGDPAIDTHPLGPLVMDITHIAYTGLAVENNIAVVPASPNTSDSGHSS